MKRWGNVLIGSLMALYCLAPLCNDTAQAATPPDLKAYKFSAPVCAKDDLAGGANFQMGRVNNKGQFSAVIANSGERVYAWDGSKLHLISDDSIKLPDGSAFSSGNVWTSLGINDAGVLAWVADTDGSVKGVKYIVTYDLNTKKYEILARPGDAVEGAGTLADGGGHGPTDRMLADINNKGQVVWNQVIAGEGDLRSGIFMYDPVTKKVTALAVPGTTMVNGKAFTSGWWPAINDEGQVVFIGSVDGGEYGIYMADGKGNVVPIAAPGTKTGDVTIHSARWANVANNGDVAFVGDVDEAKPGASETTEGTGVFLYRASDKTIQVIAKPGDSVPGGTFAGVEPSRRVVQNNAQGQVAFIGVREDGGDGIYVWQNGKVEALILGNSTVTGLGKVDGVSKGVGGVTGYHFAMSESGHIAFPAVVGGTECFVLATPPATPPTAGN